MNTPTADRVRLTQYSHGGGCACKLGARDLEAILAKLPVAPSEGLLVGLDTPDDAAVYRLDEERAVVATLDFFTPVVDDPRDFGAVAAANALSDLYAVGARPLFALNILAIPSGQLGDDVVGGILAGASDVCSEAGIPVGGGHSIDDSEPKYGLVALGTAHPDRLWRKGGGRPGDRLVLGKALGTGVVTTGIKSGDSPPDAVEATVASMRQLNRDAAEILREFEPHAVTDVTGFGLMGHLKEMCRGSGLGARVAAHAPRLLPGARDLAAAGCVPGGTGRNREAVRDVVTWDDGVDEALRVLLCDAQTSGGLLAAVPAGRADALAAAWADAGYAPSVVGELVEDGGGIRVDDR